MLTTFARRILIFFLAVLVSAGIGAAAVQASAMSFKMMDMPQGMSTPGMGSCQDCAPGASKGMTACLSAGCLAGAVTANIPLVTIADIAPLTVRHRCLDIVLIGRDSEPDPYPPRTTYIG
jgi:hypothetical protein